MSSTFLVIVALMLAFVAAIWSGRGWVNIAIKITYAAAAVWASGLAIASLKVLS